MGAVLASDKGLPADVVRIRCPEPQNGAQPTGWNWVDNASSFVYGARKLPYAESKRACGQAACEQGGD